MLFQNLPQENQRDKILIVEDSFLANNMSGMYQQRMKKFSLDEKKFVSTEHQPITPKMKELYRYLKKNAYLTEKRDESPQAKVCSIIRECEDLLNQKKKPLDNQEHIIVDEDKHQRSFQNRHHFNSQWNIGLLNEEQIEKKQVDQQKLDPSQGFTKLRVNAVHNFRWSTGSIIDPKRVTTSPSKSTSNKLANIMAMKLNQNLMLNQTKTKNQRSIPKLHLDTFTKNYMPTFRSQESAKSKILTGESQKISFFPSNLFKTKSMSDMELAHHLPQGSIKRQKNLTSKSSSSKIISKLVKQTAPKSLSQHTQASPKLKQNSIGKLLSARSKKNTRLTDHLISKAELI